MEISKLKKMIIWRLASLPPVLGLIFFLPAGTLRFWEAWIYIAILILVMAVVLALFMKKDPEVLGRRMREKEKEGVQKKVVGASAFLFTAGFLLAGFDRRWDWSVVPTALVLIADVFVIFGFIIFIRVLRENRFLSRTVEVDADQRVITTGPYSVVRHPMYAGILLSYLFTPIALGSFWALIPFSATAVVIPVRILNEEKILLRELDGYQAYMQKTKYRLIPGLW